MSSQDGALVHWHGPVEGGERYSISLDGWDVLQVNHPTAGSTADVAVNDLRATHELSWSRPVSIVDDRGRRLHPSSARRRVIIEELPFDGWAVLVDGHDLATLCRETPGGVHAAVSIYDRTDDEARVVYDACVRYRQLPKEPPSVGELLRRFSGPSGNGRSLER
jgi:hypothetical protein